MPRNDQVTRQWFLLQALEKPGWGDNRGIRTIPAGGLCLPLAHDPARPSGPGGPLPDLHRPRRRPGPLEARRGIQSRPCDPVFRYVRPESLRREVLAIAAKITNPVDPGCHIVEKQIHSTQGEL